MIQHFSPAAGGNPEIGDLIAEAMAKVGRQGVVTMEESKTAEDNLIFVEGMQVGLRLLSVVLYVTDCHVACIEDNLIFVEGMQVGCCALSAACNLGQAQPAALP